MPINSKYDAAAELIATAQQMNLVGINTGTSGNVSVRFGDEVLVTPSSVGFDVMVPDDIITMRFDETWETASDHVPSSEWRFHLDILRTRPEANAVVHAHPIQATALAAHRRGIAAFHYMVGVAGGDDIRCADYATFGTAELSHNVLEALIDRKACLLANHGIIAIGQSLGSALALAVEVEVLAGQYLAACVLGEPVQLSKAEMAEVLEKMSAGNGYGSS